MLVLFRHTHELSPEAKLFLTELVSQLTEVIVAKISEVLEEVKKYLDEDSARKDRLSTAVRNLRDDVQFLKDKVAAFENSPGDLSQANEEAWQVIRTRIGTMATHNEEVTAAAEALDNATVPVIPEPPVEPTPTEPVNP